MDDLKHALNSAQLFHLTTLVSSFHFVQNDYFSLLTVPHPLPHSPCLVYLILVERLEVISTNAWTVPGSQYVLSKLGHGYHTWPSVTLIQPTSAHVTVITGAQPLSLSQGLCFCGFLFSPALSSVPLCWIIYTSIETYSSIFYLKINLWTQGPSIFHLIALLFMDKLL